MPHLTTREKILRAAIDRLNARGFASVTSREISDRAGISNGNMTYHFPTMEDLVDAIFTEMLGESERFAGAGFEREPSLEAYADTLATIERFQKEYRCFYVDLIGLMRRYPGIAHRYRAVLRRRTTQGETLIQRMIEAGVLAPAEPDEIARLQHVIGLVLMFWSGHAEVLGSGRDAGGRALTRHVLSLLAPSLTDEGRRQYREIMHTIEETV